MSKKVGVYCPSLHNYGGGEFVTIAIANTLAQNNYDVTLFTVKPVNPKEIYTFFGEKLDPSIKNLAQPTIINLKGLIGFYQSILRSYIAKTKCDVLIDAYSNCVFPWSQVSYIHFPVLNKYAFSKTFPYLKSPHHLEVGILPHIIFEKNFVKYNQKLILVNSHFTGQEIKQYSGKQALVLYPPYTSIIKAPKENEKENLVLTISRFEPNKKLENIPKIASLTSKNIKFAVVGRLYNKTTLTNLESSVKRLNLTNRVKFYPDLPIEQKIELLSKAKIYLHTMEGEHFGISIVEAMASGCIPIVHNSGGMKEFVPDRNRYETIEAASKKVDLEISDWKIEKTSEFIKKAEYFSLKNFSKTFMKAFRRSFN